jgi:hypothetical protein
VLPGKRDGSEGSAFLLDGVAAESLGEKQFARLGARVNLSK